MTTLSELICTKINHDIIGNVGAVCNAVELLEEGDLDFVDDIKNILKTSSEVLSSRLKFFRIAFGLSNTSTDNIETIVGDYINTISSKNYPTSLSFSISNKENIKIMMLLTMILAEIMIKGGNITVQDFTIKASSPQYNQEKLAVFFDYKRTPELPQFSPILYLQQILQSQNLELSITQKDGDILCKVV